MSYISKRKSRGPKWVGFTNAIEHIRKVIGCDTNTAVNELRAALADGELLARFGPDFDVKNLSGVYSLGPEWSELVPSQFWANALIFSVGEGFATDQGPLTELGADEDRGPPIRWTVHIDRDKLLEIWSPRTTGLKKASTESSTVVQSTQLVSASEADIRSVLLEIYRTTNPAPNMNQVFEMVQSRLKLKGRTTSREPMRDILREPDFAKLRRPRGRQPRR